MQREAHSAVHNENWSLGKMKSWEQPEAGEMHILVRVIGKNNHGNDTIINNQTFCPIFVLWPSFLFIIKSIECHYLHTQGTAYKSRGQLHVSGIRTFPELLNWNILHLCAIFLPMLTRICWTNGIGSWWIHDICGHGGGREGQIFLSACFRASCLVTKLHFVKLWLISQLLWSL